MRGNVIYARRRKRELPLVCFTVCLFCRRLKGREILLARLKRTEFYARQRLIKFHRPLKLSEILLCLQRACGIYFDCSRKWRF